MNILGLNISRQKNIIAPPAIEIIPENKALEQFNKDVGSVDFNTKAFQNQLANWNVASYAAWNSRREVETYVEIDDVYSIISLLATTAALIPLYGYTVKNDEALKNYMRAGRETIQKKYYRIKSMQDLPENDPVNILLQNPNGSRFEFFEALYTLLFINGEVFLWKERLQYGVNAGVTRLHILFPTQMIVFVSQTFPQEVTGYRYIPTFGFGENIDFAPDEIIHIKYFNPRSLYQQQFRGQSPLTASAKRLSRIEGSMDVSVSQMQNGGVPGIVYDKSQPNTKEALEVGDMRKAKYLAYLNNTANKGAPYFSSGEMGYLQMGLKLVDMDVLALSKEDFAKLCNSYHVSNVLLNDSSSSTESNVQIQTKRMYTNTILPNVYRVRDALVNGLLPDFKGVKRYIDCDITGVTELQDDMQKQATALGLMDFISPNEKRKIMGFDDSDEPFMDEMLISNQKVLQSDLGGVPDPAEDPNNPTDPNEDN